MQIGKPSDIKHAKAAAFRQSTANERLKTY
jgi:hypothetical protein